jgi:hypothetical protein
VQTWDRTLGAFADRMAEHPAGGRRGPGGGSGREGDQG